MLRGLQVFHYLTKEYHRLEDSNEVGVGREEEDR